LGLFRKKVKGYDFLVVNSEFFSFEFKINNSALKIKEFLHFTQLRLVSRSAKRASTGYAKLCRGALDL
jgi:hypothetical protein